MARARSIKPGLFENELLGEADPMVTLLFVGLWTLADRDGRLEDRPKRIRAKLFPYRDGVDVDALLDELQLLGFVTRYRVGDLALIQVQNFGKHQNPHHKEVESTLPAPSDAAPGMDKPSTIQERFMLEPSMADVGQPNTEPNVLTPDSGLPEPDSGLRTADDPDPGPPPATIVRPLVDQPATLSINAQLAARMPTAATIALPVGVSAEAFDDYLAGRAAKNKAVPPSAMRSVVEEIEIAATETDTPAADVVRMMVSKGWIGVRPEWVRRAKDADGPPAAKAKAAANHTGFADRDYENDPWLARFNGTEATA